MGLIDRFSRRVAQELIKAAPTVTPISQDTMTTIAAQYGLSVPLPRDPNLTTIPFNPGNPLLPSRINNPRPDGRPDPRRYEYQVAQNINVTPTRPVPFQTLRAAAEQIDIVRRSIEVIKSKFSGIEWDIVLSQEASDKIIAEAAGTMSHARAMAEARSRFTDEISRLRQFWEQPDKANGFTFTDWLNMALEEHLVLDALAIWPQTTVGGDLIGLQILDGSTIKPLIDERGMRPTPPNPAFQQILYGYPRSEFAAPSEGEEVDGEFTSDELAYYRRINRSFTVYGLSPTERSLPLADLYLRRQQWLRAEYTDGVLPEMFFTTDATFGTNPDLLRAFENVFNDDLAGQTQQRMRAKMLPAGVTPVEMGGWAERFNNGFDDFLINAITGHFGILPTEIGYAPQTGLGGAGFQAGQAESAENIGVIPLAHWLSTVLSHLSYTFLGMPRELEFRFMPSSRKETLEEAQRRDLARKNGTMTLNEQRAEEGLPLLSQPEADYPMIVTPAGAFFITDDGLVPVGGPADPMAALMGGLMPSAEPAEEGEVPRETSEAGQVAPPAEPVEEAPAAAPARKPLEEQAEREVKAFLKWLSRTPSRPFNFEYAPAAYGEVLNKFVSIGDFDSARWYAERYLS